MGSKFSKSSKDKDKEEKKWNDFKVKAKLPERLDKYSTLPASFRRRPAQPPKEEEKTGTLPRNLNRNESFSKRWRKSIKSWASQKGLAEVSRAGRNEIEPKSEESTKPSSVILDIEKVADVGQLEEELKKSDSSSQQTEVVVEITSPEEVNDSKDEVKQIESDSKLEVINDSKVSPVETADVIIAVEPVVHDDKPAHIREDLPVLESSAENKDEILQTAMEDDQNLDIKQEMEKKASELSEEIMNEVETILTQKQELGSESNQLQTEDNESFEIVDDQEIQELREKTEIQAEKEMTNEEEEVDRSKEQPENIEDKQEEPEPVDEQTIQEETEEVNTSVPVEEDLTLPSASEDEVLTEHVEEIVTESAHSEVTKVIEDSSEEKDAVSVKDSEQAVTAIDKIEVGEADKEEKPQTIQSGVGQIPDKTLCVEEIGEAEQEITETSQSQNAGSDVEKEDLPVVSEDIQEKLKEKDIDEDTKHPEKAASVGEDENEKIEVVEDSQPQNEEEEAETEDIQNDPVVAEYEKPIEKNDAVRTEIEQIPTDKVGDLENSEKDTEIEQSDINLDMQEKIQENEEEEDKQIEKHETVGSEDVEQQPETTHSGEDKKEIDEIAEGSQNAEAGLDLSDPIWKHQWNLDCLAGHEGKKETIRDIIADIVGTVTDMANIDNDEEESPDSLEEKENIVDLVPETLEEVIQKSEDLNNSEAEDEKKGDDLNESYENDNQKADESLEENENVADCVPETSEEEIEKCEDLNTVDDERKENDFENQKVDEEVNFEAESKDEANVGIFLTEDIEELIENVEDVAGGVNDRISDEAVSGTGELTESKEKHETDKTVENEVSKEETDHPNENLIQVEVQEEKP